MPLNKETQLKITLIGIIWTEKGWYTVKQNNQPIHIYVQHFLFLACLIE